MNIDLGTRLKISRKRKGLSQKEAADKLNISNAVLSNYERNKRDPDTEILKKMAKLYSVSVDYLLGLTNNAIPSDNEDEFWKAIDDPELYTWWEELPKNEVEELKKLREMWNIIKGEEN